MCSAPVTTGAWTNEKYGYQGTKVSGKTTSCAPLSAASASALSTFDTVPPGVSRSGASWTAATRTEAFSDMARSHAHRRNASHRPGMEHEGVVLAVHEHQVEHIERVDRPDAGNQRRLAVTVQRLQRKAAGIDLAALGHELGQLVVEVLRARKCFVAELGKPALHAERHAGAIEENSGLEAFALQPQRLQQ